MCQHHYIRANEIAWVRKTGKGSSFQLSPHEYEEKIISICESRNMKYIGFVEWAGSKSIVRISCSNGHAYDVTYHRLNSSKNKMCKMCKILHTNKSKSIDEGDAIKNVVSACGNDKFIGFVGGWNGASTLVSMECANGHAYQRKYSAIVNTNQLCPKCGKMPRVSEEMAIQRINAVIGNDKFIGFVGGEWRGVTKTNLIINCGACGNNYSNSYHNFVRHGNRCRDCAAHSYKTNRPSYLYVQSISGEIEAIKFGITNKDPVYRMKQHKRSSVLEHSIVFSWKFNDGRKALDVENEIKKRWRDSMAIVPREMMKDGYTETLPADILPTFLKEVKSMCNIENVVSN
ncbi:hypothetical protein NVV11_000746 [Shigella sonnei]|nr:hypothetical protein [Shigella sonnei]EFU4213760.1 hypothetical protein [Shigella sonnei]EFW8809301.1 hypothetical protein [Shigella sonnei]EFX9426479.1 hypothetical protein [Shigella sonnei]EJT2454451.1 hypothetical protein [Shigella sonnei]